MSEADLIQRCEALVETSGLRESYISRLVFNDGKRLDKLRAGAEMFTSTREKATTKVRELERKFRARKRESEKKKRRRG